MISRFPILKVMLLLVLVLLLMNIALEGSVLANGAAGLPYPPDQSPSPDGDAGGSSLVVTLLTILQFVL
ncbi:MAG: hypothetical protein AMJ89_03815 [candidate division Zixibacteria bacterium SM23_73]|nr:MAG: hypothetical protein AMJ89_03815 [candidate division Zixibacteria bacterium SM23_73]